MKLTLVSKNPMRKKMEKLADDARDELGDNLLGIKGQKNRGE